MVILLQDKNQIENYKYDSSITNIFEKHEINYDIK